MITLKTDHDAKKDIDRLLNPVVRDWFYSRYKSYSIPQRSAVTEIHSRKNILVSAPTGATKTLTAFLAILNELVDSSLKNILEDKVYCIYVSPLKALNNDIRKNLIEPLKEMEKIHGSELSIRVMVRTGDTTQKEKSRMLQKPPHILITTPESLAIILSSPKFRKHLTDVDWFIADEIHALADNKRGVHLSLSMERLSHLAKHISRIGLSATVAPLDAIAGFLAGDRDCTIIDISFSKKMDLKVISPVPDMINVSYQHLQKQMYNKIHKLIQSHKTTLIFTNTRAATERVVDKLKDMYPKHYAENIGAHHGSLSADLRKDLESRLRKGRLKAVACSTSLELGIDIGFIDLVICLGSPKSVARTLQRIGRSGHSLDSITKGRIIVLDRDDLVECAVLLKSAIDRKIDRVQIPQNALDVLAQHIYGMAIDEVWKESEMFELIKKSYCYKDLDRRDFNEVLSYLAGEFSELEDRHVYAKIWRKDGKLGKKGRLARVIYMTNIGTIPDQSGVKVKLGNMVVGTIDEGFLERLRPGDVFVLGGSRYMFRYSRGMNAVVSASVDRPPTVPSWISESLPLSYDLALDIGRFRRLVREKIDRPKQDVIRFIHDYLYCDKNSSNAIYQYMLEQYRYLDGLPDDKNIVIEHYKDDTCSMTKIVFHTQYGRRVNDVLSRAFGYAATRLLHKEVELGMNDNGFYLGVRKDIRAERILRLLDPSDLRMVMEKAIDGSEVIKRRFRHVAGRSLMILRNYLGKKKNVSRQQMSSMLLMTAARRISEQFPILKEARREVLEDLMDICNATTILQEIKDGDIKIKETDTMIPSPFAFSIVLQGAMDIIRLEDRMQYLQRMHHMVLAMIGKHAKKEDFDYYRMWEKQESENLKQKIEDEEETMTMIAQLDLPYYLKEGVASLAEGRDARDDIVRQLIKDKKKNKKKWPEKLSKKIYKRIDEL